MAPITFPPFVGTIPLNTMDRLVGSPAFSPGSLWGRLDDPALVMAELNRIAKTSPGQAPAAASAFLHLPPQSPLSREHPTSKLSLMKPDDLIQYATRCGFTEKEDQERFLRFFRPERPHLEKARKCLEGIEDPTAAWETLIAREMLPMEWSDPLSAGFYFRGPVRGNTLSLMPPTIEAALAIAADPQGIATTIQLVKELRTRASLLFPIKSESIVIFNLFSQSDPWRGSSFCSDPYYALFKRKFGNSPEDNFTDSSEMVAGDRRDSIVDLYRDYLRDRRRRQNHALILERPRRSSPFPSTCEEWEKRRKPVQNRLEVFAARSGIPFSDLSWDNLPDVWSPFMGIADLGYAFYHSRTVKIAGKKVLGHFILVPKVGR